MNRQVAGGVVDKSRPMLAQIIRFVKYYYSTSSLQVALSCSKDFASIRKQGGRAHCASWEGFAGGLEEEQEKETSTTPPLHNPTRKDGAPAGRIKRQDQKPVPPAKGGKTDFVSSASGLAIVPAELDLED
jgi:hypothetical protein